MTAGAAALSFASEASSSSASSPLVEALEVAGSTYTRHAYCIVWILLDGVVDIGWSFGLAPNSTVPPAQAVNSGLPCSTTR